MNDDGSNGANAESSESNGSNRSNGTHGSGGSHRAGSSHETGGGEGYGRSVVSTVIVAIVTAAAAYAGNFFSDGGLIRVLGGLSVKQLTEAEVLPNGFNCPDHREIGLGDVKKTFCVLTDVSIRQGNSIPGKNKDKEGGWDVCRIEAGTGSKSGQLVLVAEMQQECSPGAEITCKARCIKF
jgi:hypothetical protein